MRHKITDSGRAYYLEMAARYPDLINNPAKAAKDTAMPEDLRILAAIVAYRIDWMEKHGITADETDGDQ